MKPVREVVSREIIDDLWGAGYTILPRRRHPDPFFVPPEMVPTTRSYQWWHLVHDKIHYERPPGAQSSGWSPVPASRHDGYFMPAGFIGDIEVSGLGLFEKSKVEVDQERLEQIAASKQQVDDWKSQWAGDFTGHVRVGHQNEAGYQEQTTQVGDTHADPVTKTIETTVRIPRDMQPHVVIIFAERDRLYNEVITAWNQSCAGVRPVDGWKAEVCAEYQRIVDTDPNALKGATLNALILPHAIENVRKQLKEAPDAT